MYPWEIWWHGKTHTVWLMPCCMSFVIQYGFCHAIASLTLGERCQVVEPDWQWISFPEVRNRTATESSPTVKGNIVFDGFLIVLMMVFNDRPPSVKHGNGYIPLFRSDKHMHCRYGILITSVNNIFRSISIFWVLWVLHKYNLEPDTVCTEHKRNKFV